MKNNNCVIGHPLEYVPDKEMRRKELINKCLYPRYCVRNSTYVLSFSQYKYIKEVFSLY